jgi:hypothetical protein
VGHPVHSRDRDLMAKDIVFSLETSLTDELWDEIIELDSKFWGNTVHVSKLGIEFKPNKDLYQYLATKGTLMMTLGRDKDTGVLVCLAVGCISGYSENPAYTTVDNFVFVIDKDSQSIKNLVKFLSEMEKLLVPYKVDLVSFNLPEYMCTKSVKEFFTKKGFFPSMTTFHKRIT